MRFTSINSESSELERGARELGLVVRCYRDTFIDVADSAAFNGGKGQGESGSGDRLRALAVTASGAAPDQFPECTAQLREILRECGEQTAAYVTRLEKERAGIEQALLDFASSLEKAADIGDQPIKSTVERLRLLSQSPEARPLRTALRAAADSVERGLEQLQRQHRLAVVNFQREIVSLHRRVDPSSPSPLQGQNAAFLDRPSLEMRLRETTPGKAWIALMRLRGFRMLCNQPGLDAASQVLAAFLARSRNTFPIQAVLGRWGTDEFVAVFPPPDASVSPMAFCRGILEGLSDPYTCVIEGRTLRPAIDISGCIVDTSARETPAQVLERVEASLLRI